LQLLYLLVSFSLHHFFRESDGLLLRHWFVCSHWLSQSQILAVFHFQTTKSDMAGKMRWPWLLLLHRSFSFLLELHAHGLQKGLGGH